MGSVLPALGKALCIVGIKTIIDPVYGEALSVIAHARCRSGVPGFPSSLVILQQGFRLFSVLAGSPPLGQTGPTIRKIPTHLGQRKDI